MLIQPQQAWYMDIGSPEELKESFDVPSQVDAVYRFGKNKFLGNSGSMAAFLNS